MASKPSADHSSGSPPSQGPSQIYPSDKVLSSVISLPPEPSILYAVFTPVASTTSHHYDRLELARRAIIIRNGSVALLDSLLTSVHISKEPCIYVFTIATHDRIASSMSTLNDLQLEGLTITECSSFTPQDLYPCSEACSSLLIPCPSCLSPPSAPSPSSSAASSLPSASSACLLPRKPLRRIYAHFLEAIRGRLINDIAEASDKSNPILSKAGGSRRQVKRLKGGVLLGPPPSPSEWGAGWEYRAFARPLIHCHLQIHLSSSSQTSPARLIIHPLLRPTAFLPLPLALPLPPGTPLTLLPHGTPAYFLTTYHGPTSGLTKQFQQSLVGMGVGEWEADPPYGYAFNRFGSSSTGAVNTGASANASATSADPLPPLVRNLLSSNPQPSAYIIAWISVENKQGEDKGIPIIWPTRLCVSFVPSPSTSSTPVASHGRQVLDYIPELPAQLQPSPPPLAHPSSTGRNIIGVRPLPVSLPILGPSISTVNTPSASAPSPNIEIHAIQPQPILNSNFHRNCTVNLPRPALSTSPTSESLRAFRTLTLSKSKDVRRVASEVGGYVDAVARERERERERIRKEREGGWTGSGVGSSPRLSRATTTPAAPTPAPPQNDPATSGQPVAGGIQPQAESQSTPSLAPAVAGPSHQQQHVNQNFYPSPPQTNPSVVPPNDTQTSPVIDSAPPLPAPNPIDPSSNSDATRPTSPAATLPTPVPILATPSTSSSSSSASFDPFGNIDPTWSQPAQSTTGNDFLDMDMGMGMDFGMGFGMNMDSITSGGGSGGAYDRVSMDYEDAFTDDDFSFFDRPSRATPAVAPPPSHRPAAPALDHLVGSGLTPAAGPAPFGMGMSPPLFGDIHISGPGPPQQTSIPHPHSHQHPSPWVSSALAEGFTPRFADHSDVVPPDLLPPSPGQTPESHSAPVTPNIQLVHEYDTAGKRPNTSAGPSVFDPIPFALSHRVADGKYAIGKFALPSPPDDEDRTEPLKLSYFPTSPNGWRFKYDAATDPRIGVVRKLIGVKRKAMSEHGMREPTKMSPAWVREHEDWGKSDAVVEEEDVKSEMESDDEDVEGSESPFESRPSTPPPSYLPLGPSLLHTQFHHSQLLPLSIPLRPPGAAVAPTNITAVSVLTSVPTPVSPAATMGAASEKSKSLEAAASMVAKEVVENSIWADAWRAAMASASMKPSTEVWQADVKSITQLLEAVPALEGPLGMTTLFGLDTPPDVGSRIPLQALELPMISVGKGDTVIQILPTALRFWEKLGLGPRGGKKDVSAFVLFEDEGEERKRQVETWLSNISATYTDKHLGIHVPGSCSSCPKDGIVPLRFDSSFRKSLASFVASLPAPQYSLVFYLVTPISTMTLASPLLRQVFSAVKKALKTYSEAQIHFQFVPEQLILGTIENPSTQFTDLEILCYSVYNRILQPVDRLMSRRFFEHGERIRNYFQEPTFTLARPIHNKVNYVRTRSLDVMDRHMFLHVGYQISQCGKWVLAACMDQRGEAHDLGVWLTQTQAEGQVQGESGDTGKDISREMYVVLKVWEFTVQFARRASIEWRIVFSKLGSMEESELDAWITHLATVVPICSKLSMLHVTLLSVEPDAPWTFIAPHASPTPKAPLPSRTSSMSFKHSHPHGHAHHHVPVPLFVDVSATTYALFPRSLSPLSSLPPLTDLSLVTEPSSDSSSDPLPLETHNLPLLPRSTTTLIRVPAETGYASVSMLHIHLLHTIQSPNSSILPSTQSKEGEKEKELHAEITRSFHELAVLAGTRWRLGVNPILPFHLAAVEAMHIALDRDRERETIPDS